MLRKIRIVIASFMLICCTLLFLDFTGTVHAYLGWVAKVQFLPALFAVNTLVLVVLLVLTLLFGRVYCSAICPMGILQDVIAFFGKKSKKNRYSYSGGITWLRVLMLLIFAVCLFAGVGSVVAMLDPYGFFGRVVSNLFAPIYLLANNLFAVIAERLESYAFYSVDVWIKSISTFAIALAAFVIVAILAWRNGRTYCNTICPVGTILGFLSKYSLLRPVLDSSKCKNCKICERNCKAACINIDEQTIDYSRCVACMDCLGKCKFDAMHYSVYKPQKLTKSAQASANGGGQQKEIVDNSRRSFLSLAALSTGAAMASGVQKTVDGGLAVLEDKVRPNRITRVLPPGSLSIENFAKRCTGCQLCVSVCPSGVLRPSTNVENLMQPEMHFNRGYCRPECTKCSEVCPTSAINKITVEEKTSIQVGRAVWVSQNCVPLTDGVECSNCARHCPSEAIQMVPHDHGDPLSLKVPIINESKCIGCGACEYLCPARPFVAIYVEGRSAHTER